MTPNYPPGTRVQNGYYEHATVTACPAPKGYVTIVYDFDREYGINALWVVPVRLLWPADAGEEHR